MTDIASPLDMFAAEERWVAWRNEMRPGAKPGDKPTKVPYSPRGGRAKADDPSTWGDKVSALARVKTLVNDLGGGLGIELGELGRDLVLGERGGVVLGERGGDLVLGGVDVDTCLKVLERGEIDIAPWAQPILRAVDSYTEISPSQTGAKMYFILKAIDVRWFLDLIGVPANGWGCRRGIPGHDPRNHGAAVEIYLGFRYFAVTGNSLTPEPHAVALLDRDALKRLAKLIPPARGPGAGRKDRSAIAYGKGFEFCRLHPGCTWEEMAEALRKDPDPDIRDWCKEKGEATGRGFKRIWEKFQQQADPTSADWPEPARLLGTAPTPRFPADFLPGAFGLFTQQQAFELQAPLDFVAIPQLIAAATTIGKEFRMAPKARANWTERACLWGACIDYVGTGKTAGFNAGLSPIWPLQRKWREEFQEELKAHKIAVKRAKVIHKQWEKDAAAALKSEGGLPDMPAEAEPPEPPICREMVTNDATQERVATMLMNNSGALFFRDELSGWFSSFNQYRPGADEQFYLQCHAGGQWSQHRIKGDVTIPDVFLCVFGGLQPNVVAAALARGAHTGKPDNGLTARFSLLAWPEPVGLKWVDYFPDHNLRERVNDLFEQLSDLDPEGFVGPRPEGSSHYPPLRFTPEARDIFRDWYLVHHQGQRAIDPDEQIKGHFAKYDGLFARLAVHHLMRYVQNEPGVEPATVDAVTAIAVRDFIEHYLRPHACKVYGYLALDPGYAGAKKIGQWLLDNPTVTRFTAREISRKGWAGLTGRDENTGKNYLRAALDHLDNVAGWVRAVEVPSGRRGGRPTITYVVNPKLPR